MAELLEAAWAPSSKALSVRLPDAVVTPAPPLTVWTSFGPSAYWVLEVADALAMNVAARAFGAKLNPSARAERIPIPSLPFTFTPELLCGHQPRSTWPTT